MRISKGKNGHKKIKYSKEEEKFYKEHKKEIIEGLARSEDNPDGVAKNQVKRLFFGNVKEEMEVSGVSRKKAMMNAYRSDAVLGKEKRFELYKEDILNKMTRGHMENIRKHLKQTTGKLEWDYTQEGFVAVGANGQRVLIKKNSDTLTDGYELVYE